MPRGLSAKQERAVQFRLPAYVQARLENDAGKYGLGINDIARCYAIAAAWRFRGEYVPKLVATAAARQQDFLTICELLTEKIRTELKAELDAGQEPYPSQVVESQLADLVASCAVIEKKSTRSPKKIRQRRVSRFLQIQFRVPSALRARIVTLQENTKSTDNEVCRRLVLFGYWNLLPDLFKRISLEADRRQCDFEVMCAVIGSSRVDRANLLAGGAESVAELVAKDCDLRERVDQGQTSPAIASNDSATNPYHTKRRILL